MKKREKVTEGDVLSQLAKAAGPASVREIARAMELRHQERRELQKIVERLKRKGEIEEAQSGRYVLAGKRAGLKPHGKEKRGRNVGAEAPAPYASRTKQTPPRESGGKSRQQAGGQAPQPKGRREAGVIAGRLVAHRDGYGFVVPDAPVAGMEGDLFVSPPAIGDAMHGDRVEARIERRRHDGRAEGRILRVTKRAHPTVVGLFRAGSHGSGNRVVPFDIRIQHEIVIPPGEELPGQEGRSGHSASAPAFGRAESPLRADVPVAARAAAHKTSPRVAELDGAVVNVELTRYPKGGVAPAGRVVEVLGRPGEIGVDIEIIIRKHYLPSEFPDEVLDEAQATPQQVRPQDLDGRRDFRALPIVTIDGETAKDFDDAVHVQRLPGGNFELQVHIADVGHYVGRGSPLDREARLRGTSVYFPDRAVPMLPEELSNGICSLNPKVDRLVMSAVMEFDARGHLAKNEFTSGVIRSAERMTYTNVNRVLEGEPTAAAQYEHLADHFRLMRELALILNSKRARRGSIDFDLPERMIEFDELGRMVKIGRSERNIAHRIIEEFMLSANEAVAAHLENRAIASLHRVHEKPDPKKVLEFEELARAFGYSMGVADLAERRVAVKHGRVRDAARGRERPMTVVLPDSAELNITPHHYQRLTEKIAGKPEERILSYLMLRSLKQARYAPEALGHFALGAEHYTHFTSPIRRYPDLIVHRVLKWALENNEAVGSRGHEVKKTDESRGPYRLVELEEISAQSSDSERRADGAERELMDWKTAQFMESHLGEEFEALVISVQKFGFFVELFEHFVEGLVSIDTLTELTGERCMFRETDHAIVTQRGRRGWRLGDRVRVRADRIDFMRHRVEFSLVEGKR
jgi:ribonuclease R